MQWWFWWLEVGETRSVFLFLTSSPWRMTQVNGYKWQQRDREGKDLSFGVWRVLIILTFFPLKFWEELKQDSQSQPWTRWCNLELRLCCGLNVNSLLQAHLFEELVPRWWHYLGRLRDLLDLGPIYRLEDTEVGLIAHPQVHHELSASWMVPYTSCSHCQETTHSHTFLYDGLNPPQSWNQIDPSSLKLSRVG